MLKTTDRLENLESYEPTLFKSIGKQVSKSVRHGVPVVSQQVKNPASICEDVGSSPDVIHWVKDLVMLQAVV